MLSLLFRLTTLLLSVPAIAVATLTPVEQTIAAYAVGQKERFAEELETAVRIDSATENLAGVRELGEWHAGQLRALGFEAHFIPLPVSTGRAGHLVAERQGTRGKRVLLIGHLDTVLPGGEFRREGDKVHGAGTNDMKGGNLIIIHALRALHAAGALDDTRLVVVMTGDEEAPGHPIEVSRRALRDAAARSDIALGFETAIGRFGTIARRGIVSWELEVQGATGHSSGLWGTAMGSGAIYELARILAEFHEQLRRIEGVTCNPAILVGGTEADLQRTGGTAFGKTNIVAQRALARGDLRYLSAGQMAEAQAVMREIVRRNLPRTSAELRFAEDGFPAMEPSPENFALLAVLDDYVGVSNTKSLI